MKITPRLPDHMSRPGGFSASIGDAIMFTPATQKDIDRYDRAVDSAIATCGGDLRGALKALIIANEYLEEELRQVLDDVSAHAVIAMPRRDVD